MFSEQAAVGDMTESSGNGTIIGSTMTALRSGAADICIQMKVMITSRALQLNYLVPTEEDT